MKWPESLMLIRHDTSEYNVLRDKKKGDPLYDEFLVAWGADPEAETTVMLARQVQEKFSLGVSDANAPLADSEGRQAYQTGLVLAGGKTPDMIFVSPYLRALMTLEHLTRGWSELSGVKTHEEERVREQDHGLALLYNDWRVFETLHPEQRRLRKLLGPYWYRYPQGENVPDVRERNRSWLTTLTRDFAEQRILVVTHHLNILATRANLERFGEAKFTQLDEEEKPINCGVTCYLGNPRQGKERRMPLAYYNRKNYS